MHLLADRSFWLGLILPCAAGAAALVIGRLVPTLGAPVVGIVLGLLIGQFLGQPAAIASGTRFCAHRVLQAAIVLLGAGLSLSNIGRIGLAGLPVLVGTILVAVGLGLPLTRWLRVERQIGTLVTYGTTICGASAIATMSQVIGAAPTAVAVSIAVIVIYNVLAAIAFPYLGHAFGLAPESFGLWAGTAVNDTSSVLAAATSYDHLLMQAGIGGGAAAGTAVVVKLTRTLALIPLAVFEQWRWRRVRPLLTRAAPPSPSVGESAQPGSAGDPTPTSVHPGQPGQGGDISAPPARLAWFRLIPGFLVLFLIAATINSVGLIPEAAGAGIKFAAVAGTTIAMVAIGMSSSFAQIRRAGWRPLALGGILWLAIIATAIGLQVLTGQWNTLTP